MPTSAIPAVIDALVSLSDTALSEVTVYDGYGISEDPGDFLMVGVEDPDSDDAASSSEASQSAATMGTSRTRDEVGSVTCVALSWNGDADQKRARDDVFATTAAIENLLRTNPTLGLVPTYQSLVAQFGSDQRLMQSQTDASAEAAVIFTVAFRARL